MGSGLQDARRHRLEVRVLRAQHVGLDLLGNGRTQDLQIHLKSGQLEVGYEDG